MQDPQTLASLGVAAGENTMSMNTFVESQPVPKQIGINSFLSVPCDFVRNYSWAEQEYRVGEITALVAVYKNIPVNLKEGLGKLVSTGYCKNLFLPSFFEASLLLLSSGILPSLKSMVEPSRELYAAYDSSKERQKASDFISMRKPDDIVVLVLKSGELVGSMTLYPFDSVNDMPSLSYLELQATESCLSNVPAVEIGRLARSAIFDEQHNRPYSGLLKTVWIAAAFLVSRDFGIENGLVSDPNSFVCGDTYGSLLASLQHFFPVKVIPSSIRSDILEENNAVRDVAMYFLQRQVLGSFESADYFIEAVNTIEKINPKLACRIVELMETGLRKLGIKSLRQFDAKKFKIDFFYFPFHHIKTTQGFDRLEKVIRKLTSKQTISLH
jgi:hypothetical protein